MLPSCQSYKSWAEYSKQKNTIVLVRTETSYQKKKKNKQMAWKKNSTMISNTVPKSANGL